MQTKDLPRGSLEIVDMSLFSWILPAATPIGRKEPVRAWTIRIRLPVTTGVGPPNPIAALEVIRPLRLKQEFVFVVEVT